MSEQKFLNSTLIWAKAFVGTSNTLPPALVARGHAMYKHAAQILRRNGMIDKVSKPAQKKKGHRETRVERIADFRATPNDLKAMKRKDRAQYAAKKDFFDRADMGELTHEEFESLEDAEKGAHKELFGIPCGDGS